jgi:nucleoside-diphosphate-sugar epimerase
MNMERILVIGANGQIGSELVEALSLKHGADNVFASDISPKNLYGAAQYQVLNVLDDEALAQLISSQDITQVYQLAAMLSATGEQAPLKAWKLNMDGLLNILEIARERGETGKPLKVFWPSSIAAFGPNTPQDATPQMAVMDPTSIYGISKLAGERLCEYYHLKYGVDVRSIRYPGIISYKSPPGGGTTDYAIAIFHAALRGRRVVLSRRTGRRHQGAGAALRDRLQAGQQAADRRHVAEKPGRFGCPRRLGLAGTRGRGRDRARHAGQYRCQGQPGRLTPSSPLHR